MAPTNPSKPVVIPSAWELDWFGIPTTDGNVPGPALKILREDADTGALTFMTHLPPNWHDPLLDWHPSTEEGYIIAGEVMLGDRQLTPGSYLFRPPGILHGPVAAPNDLGATIVQRTNAPLRILRYRGKKFPHKDCQPITRDHLRSDVAWSEQTDTTKIRWQQVGKGGWKGARLRWVHENTRTGGGLVMLDLPAGWSGKGSAARGPLEEFVLAGELKAGGQQYGKWGYAYRPAGQAAGRYATKGGARLLAWWNGANEL
jgi:hypothetical protein